jgi:hypothetical protein
MWQTPGLRPYLSDPYLPLSSLFLLALKGYCTSPIYTDKITPEKLGFNCTYLSWPRLNYTVFALCVGSVFTVFALRGRLPLGNSSFPEYIGGFFWLIGSGALGKVPMVLEVNLVNWNLVYNHLLGVKMVVRCYYPLNLSVITSCCWCLLISVFLHYLNSQ